MKSKIDVPDELAHLIEKREQTERRASPASQKPAADAPKKPAGAAARERRRGTDRRGK
jgi:hypothetical protein